MLPHLQELDHILSSEQDRRIGRPGNPPHPVPNIELNLIDEQNLHNYEHNEL